VRFDPEECNSQDGPVCFDEQEGKSQDEEVVFALEGGNSRDDQAHFTPVRLAPLHLAPLPLVPAGGNSHDEQVRFAPEGGQLVERFGELDLGLVHSLRDPTALGLWGVVTDRSP